jgi:hypothetical protein
LLLALLVGVQVAPMLSPGYFGTAILGSDSYRSHDWLEVAKLDHYARKSLREWKRFPLWNPLMAGGIPQFSHPSDGSASPLILSSLALGEVRGMKLNVALVALIGTLGVFSLLVHSLGLSQSAAFMGAACYAGAGWLPSRVAVGFYESCLMAAWPAILALWLAPGGIRQRRRRWVGGALLLWTLAIQLQLAVPVLVLLMTVLAGVMGIQNRLAGARLDRPLLLGAAGILGLAGLLGAVKFLPMLDLLNAGQFRRLSFYPTHPDAWYRSWDQLAYALFHRVPGLPFLDTDGGPRVQEYMTLAPGLGTLLLAGIGSLSIRSRNHRGLPWLVMTAFFLWLCFGPNAPIDGFAPLHKLPLFSSMRGPLRYLNYPVVLGLCILAGLGFDVLLRHLPQRRTVWTVPALVLLALALSWPTSWDARQLYRSSFLYGIEDLPKDPGVASEGLRGRSSNTTPHVNLRKYVNTRRGVPTIYVPEDLPMDVAALPAVWVGSEGDLSPEPAYRGEVRVEPDGAGEARITVRRGQELVIEHDLEAPARVIINSNAWRGWRCSGRQLVKASGLLAFGAPAGQGGVTRCFWRPRRLTGGAILSALGLLGLVALWPWRTGRIGRRGGRPPL